jgi:hypothetical protein
MHFWIFRDGNEFLLKVPAFVKHSQAMSNSWMIQIGFRHRTNERGVFISYDRPQNTGESMAKGSEDPIKGDSVSKAVNNNLIETIWQDSLMRVIGKVVHPNAFLTIVP